MSKSLDITLRSGARRWTGSSIQPDSISSRRTVEFSQLARADKWGYREEDAAFISACLGERPSAVDAWEAYKSIELCEACELSALNGGEQVTLPLIAASPGKVVRPHKISRTRRSQ